MLHCCVYCDVQDGEKKGIAKGLRTVVGERFGEEAVKGDYILLVYHIFCAV